MKRVLSLAIAMVMMVLMGSFVHAEETALPEMLPPVLNDSVVLPERAEYQRFVEHYAEQFPEDSGLKETFLNRVAQMEADDVAIDHLTLKELYREIVKEDRAKRMPDLSIPSHITAAEDAPSTTNISNTSGIYIDNPEFLSGFEGDTEIVTMAPGFVRSRFAVRNDNSAEKAIMTIVKLVAKDTNALLDLAIVNKEIPAQASETITAGFNVPLNAENYEIEIIAWDSEMNLQADIIFFPEPQQYMELQFAYPPTGWITFNATGNVAVKYNGKTEIYEQYGSFQLDPPETPVIFQGDLTSFDAAYCDVSSFKSEGLSNLTSLTLDGNRLTTFDGTGLSNLTNLNLSLNSLKSFDGTDMPKLESLLLDDNGLTSFDGSTMPHLTRLILYYNLDLTSVTLPQFADIASGDGGFDELNLCDTALGNQSALNDVWNNLIACLPVRHEASMGKLRVSNETLKTLLQNALDTPINKYWTVYTDPFAGM